MNCYTSIESVYAHAPLIDGIAVAPSSFKVVFPSNASVLDVTACVLDANPETVVAALLVLGLAAAAALAVYLPRLCGEV